MNNAKLLDYSECLLNLSPTDASKFLEGVLLNGLGIKVNAAMERCTGMHEINFGWDQYETYSADGMSAWRKVDLHTEYEDDDSEENNFQFNSAGSFEVNGSKHLLRVLPLIAAAHQVCQERRDGNILDSELISISVKGVDEEMIST